MRNILLTMTEVGMIVYWLLACVVTLGIINIPAEYMYSDYENPLIVAWNWSFFPLDLIFAVLGLFARFSGINIERQALLSTVSLSLMFCAGLMAISFWLINRDFDPLWWLINIWLVCLSSIILFSKYREANA